MNRRDFLRRSTLIAAGVVAADQIELLERLAPRRLWPSIAMTSDRYEDWNHGLIDVTNESFKPQLVFYSHEIRNVMTWTNSAYSRS